jgi:hypothetical protein
MPDDLVRPDQLDGEQRFRVTWASTWTAYFSESWVLL